MGQIPAGLSLQEANFGLFLSKMFGGFVLTALFVRIPFALLGLSSIFLMFILVFRVSGNFSLAFLSTAILGLSPWHIHESRIFSLGIVILFSFVLLILALSMVFTAKKFVLPFLLLFLASFSVSSLLENNEVRNRVNYERESAFKSGFRFPTVLFSNKVIEGVRSREEIIFDNLDFGNYLFGGHPRQRWGIEEIQKFYAVFLPLFLVGISKIKFRIKYLVLNSGLLIAAGIVFFSLRSPSATLLLIFPIALIIASGLHFLLKPNKKFFTSALLSIFAFEVFIWSINYFSDSSESLFSPRRKIYQELVPALVALRQPEEKVMVNERLGDPEPFFKFYSKNTNGFEFRNFNIKSEKIDADLIVDVLPDAPSPKEALYEENGKWPEEIEVLAVFYDENLRQKAVVYNLK